jgi:hypothetical protein
MHIRGLRHINVKYVETETQLRISENAKEYVNSLWLKGTCGWDTRWSKNLDNL